MSFDLKRFIIYASNGKRKNCLKIGSSNKAKLKIILAKHFEKFYKEFA